MQICNALWLYARHDQRHAVHKVLEAVETPTDLNNLIIRPSTLHTSFQKFYGDKNKCFATSNNLKTFGKEFIVTDRTKIKAKVRDRGKKYLWLAYAKNQSSDT